MKILFDTSVVLDVLLDREPFSIYAVQLFARVERSELVGYLGATTVTTVHYLLRKALGDDRARRGVGKLLALFAVAPVNRAVLDAALTSRFTDFEDAVLHESARHVGSGGIVTRNTKDFRAATLPIYSPQELQGILLARAGSSDSPSSP